MFKQALATVAATICCLGNPSAMAAPTACWVATKGSPDRVPAQTCDVSIRINANGHKVVDIVTIRDNQRLSVVFWKDKSGKPEYAEVFFSDGHRSLWGYRYDEQGDVHLFHPATRSQLWFRPPSDSASTISA